VSDAFRRSSTFVALQYPNFRRYWYSNLGGSIALGMQFLTLGWLVMELTKSASQLGLVMFLYGAPTFIMMLLGGIAADLIERRKLLVYTQALVTITVTLMAFLLFARLLSVWHIYGFSLILGAFQGLNLPSRFAIIGDLVDREAMLNATALSTAVFNGGRVMGPVIGGWVIDWVSMEHTLLLTTVLNIISLFFLWRMPANKAQTTTDLRNVFKDFYQGLHYLASTPLSLSLVITSATFGFFGATYMNVLPGFAQEVLRVQAGDTGMLSGASGVGAIAGGILLARLGNVEYKSLLLFAMILLFGFSLILFSITPIYLISLVILFGVGVGFSNVISLMTTIFQLSTPPEFRGRLMGFLLVGAAFSYLGSYPIGLVADYYGWSLSIGGSALFMILISGAIRLFVPVLRDFKL